MRTVLLALALAAAIGGCAKKSPAAPAAPAAAPGNTTGGAPAEADEDKDKSSEKGDPCDGGETKGN